MTGACDGQAQSNIDVLNAIPEVYDEDVPLRAPKVIKSNIARVSKDETTVTLIKGVDVSIDFCPKCTTRLCPIKGIWPMSSLQIVNKQLSFFSEKP